MQKTYQNLKPWRQESSLTSKARPFLKKKKKSEFQAKKAETFKRHWTRNLQSLRPEGNLNTSILLPLKIKTDVGQEGHCHSVCPFKVNSD